MPSAAIGSATRTRGRSSGVCWLVASSTTMSVFRFTLAALLDYAICYSPAAPVGPGRAQQAAPLPTRRWRVRQAAPLPHRDGLAVAERGELPLQGVHAGGDVRLGDVAQVADADNLALQPVLAARDDDALALAQRLCQRLAVYPLRHFDGCHRVGGMRRVRE